jgi:hypothetical protein
VIPGDHKATARALVVEHVCERIEAALASAFPRPR